MKSELENITDLEKSLVMELSDIAFKMFTKGSNREDYLEDEIALVALTQGYELHLGSHDRYRLRVILYENHLDIDSISILQQGTPEQQKSYAKVYKELYNKTAKELGW